MKKIFYFLTILSVLFISACSKDKNTRPIITNPDVPGSVLDKIKDSIFLYAKEDYLWYSTLPTYLAFQPRSYSSIGNEVNSISQIAINPATGIPYEYYIDNPGEAKYSFIDSGQTSAALNGNRGDYGFGIFYNELDYNDLRVSYIYSGSPADQAGIKRGYRITSVNGRTAVGYDGQGYGNGSYNNYNFVINAYRYSNTITMTLLKPDGTTITVTNMAIANYNVNPVLTYKTFDEGGGKIVGYIVFNTFTSDANADPYLNQAFDYFSTQGVTDLVVDLRYNSGGYVLTAEHLDNLIVPTAKSGTPMYTAHYNDILTSGKEVLLKNQWRKDPTTGTDINYGPDYSDYTPTSTDNNRSFNKQGTLNVNRVFFIITGGTASASELTINNLFPEMNVQLIGETSYGKPVGFFDIDINKYTVYIPEFYVENSANQGNYYMGFTPGTAAYQGIEDYDDLTKDFGDPTEGLLADAIHYVVNGTYAVKSPVVQSLQANQRSFSLADHRALTIKMNEHNFTGMLLNRKPCSKKR
jgi:carboxyl-terminal processing protease